MIILGLTGSIGMGKSTVSAMFADSGVPVWDADAQVHAGYEGATAAEDDIYQYIRSNYPEATKNARVDRQILGGIVFNDPVALKELERVFGHYLELEMGKFIASHRWASVPPKMILLDVPLLLENRWIAALCDYVAVAHCSADEQRARCLRRPGMTDERLDAILANQMPSEEKVKSADIKIDTSKTMLEVRQWVSEIIEHIDDQDWVARLMYNEDGLML